MAPWAFDFKNGEKMKHPTGDCSSVLSKNETCSYKQKCVLQKYQFCALLLLLALVF